MPLSTWAAANTELIAVCGAAIVGLKLYLLHEESKENSRQEARTERARIYAEARRAERAAEAGAMHQGFTPQAAEPDILTGLLANPQVLTLISSFLGKKGGGGASEAPGFQAQNGPPTA